MKKIFLKILFGVLFSLFLFTNKVEAANEIKKITMDIYIDKQGDAHITEVWNASLTEGTEGYKPYYNLGDSKIKDYKVMMDGKEFTTTTYWDTSSSFYEKSYKSGINYINNGLELCWGISHYGMHTYTLTYKITNFVVSLNDADMSYWTLIPNKLSSKPKQVDIKITSDEAFEKNIDVWGFGNYGGLAYVHDGAIYMSSDGVLNSNEYMTILIKFPKGKFSPMTKIDTEFNNYLNMAKDGAKTYKKDWSEVLKIILYVLASVILIFLIMIFLEKFYSRKFLIIFFIVVCLYKAIESLLSPDTSSLIRIIAIIIFGFFIFQLYKNSGCKKIGSKKIYFGKKLFLKSKEKYFRDIPTDKSLDKAYWIATAYGLSKNKSNILGAYLLDWINKGYINVKKITKTGIFKYKEEQVLVMKPINESEFTEPELNLYNMLKNISKDEMLRIKDFVKWGSINYDILLEWFDELLDYTTLKLDLEGHLPTIYYKKAWVILSNQTVDDKIHEQAKQMKGLKNFLKNFSNIKERNMIEVNIWKEYLIYAQLFGIAKKVSKNFKNLYPEMINDNYYETIIFVHNISHRTFISANNARSRAESYSSGGGGFSSGGGGGGSFGGGSGGGGFR